MKTHWTAGLLLGAVAAVANAQMLECSRPQAGSVDAPSVVLPISVQDDEHRNALRLRDTLRQPFDDMQESGGKPYRLSPEERHRLREQLRSQPEAEQNKGKS